MRIRLAFFAVVLAVLSFTSLAEVASNEAAARQETRALLPGIVFVAASMFDDKIDGNEGGVYQGSFHWRDSYVYARSATYHRAERTMGPVRPGRNLYSLVPATPDGHLKQLTFLKTGAVFKPEPSFDGQQILFSMRRDGEDWFNLYEMNVDGSNLRQLTDGPFNDFAGTYLPDGRIVFVSDRTGYLEEYHEERTECLFVMNPDGSNIHQITFAPGTYFEPSVMQDGRILFSFWDAFHIDTPPLDKHETYLMTVNPDGSEERHLFGSGQYQFLNRQRHGSLGLTQAREMPDGRILCQSELGPSLIDLSRGTDIGEALAPIFPGTTSIQIGGTGHAVHLSPLGTRSTAYPLPDGRILFSATEPGARDSAIYICDPNTREEQLVLNIPNYAEFDAVPVLTQRGKARKLPIVVAKPEHYASGCIWSSGSSPEKHVKPNTTRFLVVAGRTSDKSKRSEALQRTRYLRVIEGEYTGVTTSSHTNLETRILGMVPLLPDGSAYFEAPADTPLFLDALDAGGNRVLHEWSFPNTSVPVGSLYPMTQIAYMVGRPGETKSCYGCHAPQTDAVPNTTVQALRLGAVQITRESTDLQYRRNEPVAYRRQARVGEADRYRPWLASADTSVRARGCEMLMHVEDGTEAALPQLAALLKDQSTEVRRAAALTLTRLGTSDQVPLLREAEKDADWLVRYHAATALEAIGLPQKVAENLEAIGRLGKRATAEQRQAVRDILTKEVPPLAAIRAVGKLHDEEAVPLIVPWLKRHDWEYHAAEAAVALGRIGTPAAVDALWAALRSEIPIKQVVYARYLQHGPRPEEYALLKGLVLAKAKPALADIHLLIALLPNTFTEKPRFEDRMRGESQRVLMPRLLLENVGLRKELVDLLVAVLARKENKGTTTHSALYKQVLQGINLERPFSEHGRLFNVVKEIGAEEALWLLTCLAQPGDVPEELVIPFLKAKNHRERIDAAVLLGLHGFGSKAADALLAEASKPYSFPEIWSIGKGMPDENFRDKAYMVQSLATHVPDVGRLTSFADPKNAYRDIRYGLTRGLARRGKPDGIPILIEMATADPLTLIRQQARYALADIQDAGRLRGEPIPPVSLPPEKPLEALYPPRGLRWTDTRLDAFPNPPSPPLRKGTGGVGAANGTVDFRSLFTPRHFHDLNMAQCRGADRMMIRQVAEAGLLFTTLTHLRSEPAAKTFTEMLELPYPHAHYLATRGLAELGSRDSVPVLIAKLEPYLKSQDTVGFWWCCEALAKLKAKDALPALGKYAVATNAANTFGPDGAATGYVAAKALARIAADSKQADVARLLKSDNVWLRAGVLRGLAQAKAPGIQTLLRQAASNDSPALVKAEAEIQLRRLQLQRP